MLLPDTRGCRCSQFTAFPLFLTEIPTTFQPARTFINHACLPQFHHRLLEKDKMRESLDRALLPPSGHHGYSASAKQAGCSSSTQMPVSQGLEVALSSIVSPCIALARGTLGNHFLAQDPSTQNAPDCIGVSDEKLLSGKANL